MKHVKFRESSNVPDFEQLLVSPDLSNNALKGLLINYEKNRKKMEDQIEQYKMEFENLKQKNSRIQDETNTGSEMSRTQDDKNFQISKDLERELKEFRKESNTIKNLQAQISVLVQERDSALSMWAATEKQLQHMKQEFDSPRYNQKVQYLIKETQNMQRDYSDAIHLLEGKLTKKQEDASILHINNEKIKQDLQHAEKQKKQLEDEVRRLEEEINKISKDKAELSEALERCLSKVKEAKEMEEIARSKVLDAVDLAQQALIQEDCVSDEKQKLQNQLKQLTESTTVKHQHELEDLMKRFQQLTNQLKLSEKERLDLSEEFERVKLECYNKLREVIDKNKSLSNQCKELHHRSYTEKLQWSEERKMLRSQIMTLQSCLERVNVNLRERKLHSPSEMKACKRCSEMKKKASNYKKIASRWRKAAIDLQEKLGKREKTTK